jgi:hypothetical protein
MDSGICETQQLPKQTPDVAGSGGKWYEKGVHGKYWGGQSPGKGVLKSVEFQ